MAGAAAILTPKEAKAISFQTTQYTTISTGGWSWFLSNSVTAVAKGLGIGYATSTSTDDPLIGAFVMTVNGTGFQAPGGILDISGNTVTTNTTVMSGLTTSAQFYFRGSTVRVIYTYTNNTANSITATIQWQNNIYGGGSAPIVAVSNGGTTETPASSWVIAWDNEDSPVTMARYGPAGTLKPAAINTPGNSSALLVDQYSLTVPAGQTRMLMFFGQLSTSTSQAIANSGTFNNTGNLASAGLLTGLTVQQESEIVNWFASPNSVPAAGSISLLMTVALVAALGVKYLKWPLPSR